MAGTSGAGVLSYPVKVKFILSQICLIHLHSRKLRGMANRTVVECDSKLLSGFPWSIIFKSAKTKLPTEYESVTQKVLFGNAVLAALMSGRKYDVIPQNGDCSSESNMRTLVFRNEVRH
jgi:hypothetical protein